MKKLALFVIGLLTLGLSVALPVSVLASSGVGGSPANPDSNNPRSKSIFIYTLDQNQSKADAVVVSNNSSETKTVQLYAADGLATNTGSFSCKQKIETSEDAGAWIQLSKAALTLVPGARETVPFTVHVPDGASTGEHNACVVFQEIDNQPGPDGNVNLRFRSAIRVAVTVPGDIYKKVSITAFDVQATSSKQLYTLAITNDGNVSADADVAVTLKNIFGGTEYHNGGGYPLLPMDSFELRFENTKPPFWGGLYFAQATVRYDTRPNVFGTEPSDSIATLDSSTKLVLIPPTTKALIIELTTLALLLVIGFFVIRRHQLHRHAHTSWPTYTVKPGDTLPLLSERYGIPWKKLARINRIKPPYSLKPGQKIHVPPRSSKTVNLSE